MTPKKEFKSVIGDMLSDEIQEQTPQHEEQAEPIEQPTQIKKMGRKPKNPEEEIEFYKFKINKSDLELLRALAIYERSTIKDILQEALKDYLNKPEKKGNIEKAKAFINDIRK